jgi:hypothetical protein
MRRLADHHDDRAAELWAVGRSKAEVGEGALALPVLDEPGDVAVADVEHMRSLLGNLQPASLAAPAAADEHEHPMTIQLAVLLCLLSVRARSNG